MGEKADVLIVDDNASMLRTTALILKHKGYNVVTAQSGLEAIERVKEQGFDIVFMDIKMPVLNGVETYQKLKEVRSDIIVMMMTAYAVKELVQQALDEGAYGIIYKPLDIDKVLAAIEEVRDTCQGAFILIVDGDQEPSYELCRTLSSVGYRVSIAKTDEEAIALVHEMTPEIVFLDTRPPTLHGVETFLKIKEIRPKTVTIMMTTNADDVCNLIARALRDLGCVHLQRPFDIENLLELIQEIRYQSDQEGAKCT